MAYHPKPEYWQNLLHSIYANKLTDRQTLQVYRLSADVGALKPVPTMPKWRSWRWM